jgi:hypothetical protein
VLDTAVRDGALAANPARQVAMEERFPDADTLEKLASVNDAIVGVKIENLEKAVAELKHSALTKVGRCDGGACHRCRLERAHSCTELRGLSLRVADLA